MGKKNQVWVQRTGSSELENIKSKLFCETISFRTERQCSVFEVWWLNGPIHRYLPAFSDSLVNFSLNIALVAIIPHLVFQIAFRSLNIQNTISTLSNGFEDTKVAMVFALQRFESKFNVRPTRAIDNGWKSVAHREEGDQTLMTGDGLWFGYARNDRQRRAIYIMHTTRPVDMMHLWLLVDNIHANK